MKKPITGKVAIALIAVILGACATGGDIKQTEGSGFPRDYSVLQEAKDAQGNTIRTWVSPKLTPARYNAILLGSARLLPRAQAKRAGER